MFATDPAQLNPMTFAEAAAGAGDLRPALYGLLLLLAMAATLKMISTAAELAREAFQQLMLALRALFFALVVATFVVALVLLAFADLLAQG